MPNTCHAKPRTVRQLCRNDSSGGDPPSTMHGTISDQNVSRIRPGTMMSANPMKIPIAARIDAAATGRTYGSAADSVPRRSRSTRPSRTSCTAFTSAACSRNIKNRLMNQPTPAPMFPAAKVSNAPMIAAIR